MSRRNRQKNVHKSKPSQRNGNGRQAAAGVAEPPPPPWNDPAYVRPSDSGDAPPPGDDDEDDGGTEQAGFGSRGNSLAWVCGAAFCTQN